LAAFVEHPYASVASESSVVRDDEVIKKILHVVLQRKGVDFLTQYKKNTIYRRILRRMALHKTLTLKDYLRLIRQNGEEAEQLYHDFLIQVTSFLIEPAFYKALEKTVFPKIVKTLQPAEPIRIWIAGCSTGEEAHPTGHLSVGVSDEKKRNAPCTGFCN
jgi:two-component system CheB/CheR fusion protein